MKKLLGVLLIFSFSQAYSQGKVISTERAEQYFGKVEKSVEVETNELISFISKNVGSLMFNIKADTMAVILNKDRELLSSREYIVTPEESFTVYSLEKIINLLIAGGKEKTVIEQRENVLTLTNGNYTLEYGAPCPPMCE